MVLIPSLSDGFRLWNLYNRETNEIFVGQFHAEELRHEGMEGMYSERWALGRTNPVQQFLRGALQKVSFRSRLYAGTAVESAEDKISTLKSWTQADTKTGRPPVLEFWIGDGGVEFFENPCVLESLSDLHYHRPTLFGNVRHVEFTVTLREYKTFKLQEEAQKDTRYHRVKQGEYYELIAFREYQNPLLGDPIRKRHPTQATLEVGDVVALPTVTKLLRERTVLTSIPLATAFGRKDTPQRALRIEWFDRRDVDYVSHILVEH
jgi:hypothetical protein